MRDLRAQWDCTRRLGDEEWTQIAASLPGRLGSRARNATETRRFVESVLWVAATGARWTCVPAAAFGPWHGVYVRFARWAQRDAWRHVVGALQDPALRTALAALVAAYLDERCRREVLQRLEDAAPALQDPSDPLPRHGVA
ncbi:transposase [Xanthomonas sacchari]|uniref:transposase n=1 Tax=Xanthomonas sacchari TaxID=56458 RepID=UPI0020C2B89F|nr:transposase [Xanthomonas sacchari]MDQ1091816.1 transposase [Xanthomonas sacchari]